MSLPSAELAHVIDVSHSSEDQHYVAVSKLAHVANGQLE